MSFLLVFTSPCQTSNRPSNYTLNMQVPNELPKWNAYARHNLILRVMEGDLGALDASQAKLDYK